MKELKLRAWHKTLKVMLNVYVMSQEKYDDGYKQNCKGWYGTNNQITFAYDQADWLQFTGLKDKNGKEIYEGDVVEFWDEYMKKTRREVVQYIPPRFIVYGTGDKTQIEDTKVIGKIYENPELLNQPEEVGP